MATRTKMLAAKQVKPPPPPAVAPAPLAPQNAEFARRLHRALQAQKMSASDLAAAIWGRRDVMIDGKHASVARNRERISVYLQGRSFPREQHLVKMAEALGMRAEDLAPGAGSARLPPPVALTLLDGAQARLTVDTVLSADVALQITRLIERARAREEAA